MKISEGWLGSIDSSFWISSTIGNLLLGPLVDRYPHHKLIPVFTSLSSLTYILISSSGYLSLTAPIVYLLLLTVQGLCQSPLYPAFVSLVSHTYNNESKGKALSLLSTSICFGNFLGAFLTGIQLDLGVSWKTAMVVYALFMFCISICILIYTELGYKTLIKPDHESLLFKSDTQVPVLQPKAMSLSQLIQMPNLKPVIVCKMCVKFMYYSLNMWMPLYLSTIIDDLFWVGLIAGSIEIGGMIGAVICGYLVDLIKSCGLVLNFYFFLSMPVILIILVFNLNSAFVLLPVLFILGVFIGGSNLILITLVPAYLAQHPYSLGFEVVGSITSVLDASGSLGAAIGMVVVGQVVTVSWDWYFVLILGNLVASFLLILPLTLFEYRQKINDGEKD